MPSTPPTKPAPPLALPPFWKGLMRGAFAVTMALFLAPAVYVVKYYAVDKPREEDHRAMVTSPFWTVRSVPLEADYLPLMEEHARSSAFFGEREAAVERIGETLRQPYISVKRPLECLSAKATLADLATHAPNPAVRAAASEELGRVALGGAVIRR